MMNLNLKGIGDHNLMFYDFDSHYILCIFICSLTCLDTNDGLEPEQYQLISLLSLLEYQESILSLKQPP